MSTSQPRLTISIAQTEEEISQALAFCGSVYEQNYGTHWTVPPDVFFVAREKERIVATGGLTFAALHEQIASERYFRLTDGMRHFIETNRERIVEFGRFASITAVAAKAILHSCLSYSTMAGIDFMFAWANPSVYKYTANRLGLNFWPIVVPLNLDNALNDSRWASPPTGFFQREQPPELILGVVPFWENVTKALAEECYPAAILPAWQINTPDTIQTVMKPTSFALSAPRLLRSEDAASRSASAESSTVPSMPPAVESDTLPVQQPKAE